MSATHLHCRADRTRALGLIAVLSFLAPLAHAQDPDALARYQPEQKIVGTLRSWGSNEMASLLGAWQAGFSAYQPEVRYADTLKGNETAQAGLYTQVADLALMSRDILLLERYGLYKRWHHYPLEITVATGSHSDAERTFALAVLVHKDNPLSKLTLQQLDGIFGEQRSGGWDETNFSWRSDVARGAQDNIRTWGELGLKGRWVNAPIRVYGYPITTYASSVHDQGAMAFFRKKVLAGAAKWNAELLEFEKGDEIVQSLGNDPYGIAFTAMGYRTPQLKAVALASAQGGDYFLPTRASVASRSYPLTRSIHIYIDRPSGRPVDPKVKEFLKYVLSREGQQAIAQDGGYLPLTADVIREQLQKLE